MDAVENTNTYDEAAYERASSDVIDGIVGLWEAGASVKDVQNEVAAGLAAAGLSGSVLVQVRP